MQTKYFVLAVMTAIVLNLTSCTVGSDNWMCLTAATYLKVEGLKDSDDKLLSVNDIQSKEDIVWQDKRYMYVVVKYTVKMPSGNREQRLLHMLFTEDGKQSIDISLDGKKGLNGGPIDWIPTTPSTIQQ